MENCIEKTIEELVQLVPDSLRKEKASHYNYERYLITDKAPYLIKFIEGETFPPFEVEIQMYSNCNLQCMWCIGVKVQKQESIMRLPNNINKDNIDKIVDGIVNFRMNGLRIEKVKFSGFIGEPLLNKEATLRGIAFLTRADPKIQVGLFTNGVFLDDDITRQILLNIEYIHVSLDAGPNSFHLLKTPNTPDKSIFNKILSNIKNLSDFRKKNGGKVQITCGYVIVPGNVHEIYETTQLVRTAGADAIRFKIDISDKHDLQKTEMVDKVFEQINRVKQDFNTPPSFTVHFIHSEDDIKNINHAEWQRKNGCFFHNFIGAVGSDGNVYLCNHNTIFDAIPLGNAINQPFEEIWNRKRRENLTSGTTYKCLCDVCSPFGNRANFLLKKIHDLTDQHGVSCVKEALLRFRSEATKIIHNIGDNKKF